MNKTRTEKDSLGEVQVPETALYGAQTQRAVENFGVSGQPMPRQFIHAILLIKRAAASAYQKLGMLPQPATQAIIDAVDSLVQDGVPMEHFPVDIYQTGSGTSTNMNVNEVVAAIARRDGKQDLSPNDDVNFGQSSNDVIPTAINLSCAIALQRQLIPALEQLIAEIQQRAAELAPVVKTGRTHLMDAMPIRFDQCLGAWKAQLDNNHNRLAHSLEELSCIAQGGTAVGTGVNSHPEFPQAFCEELGRLVDIRFQPMDSLSSGISSQDVSVNLSGVLKSLAVVVLKICNDLRWMNSGPLSGLSEIELEALQPGSSIMPGKVNPVIPESAAMAAVQVIANDTAITLAGEASNFELNTMLPLIAAKQMESIELMANASQMLAERAIRTFKVNRENIAAKLHRNPVLATALNPIVGYAKAAEIAKRAYSEQRTVLEIACEEIDGYSREELEKLLDPAALTGPGNSTGGK